MQNNTEQDFPNIKEVAQEGLCDFHLPPLASIVHIRAGQIMDALPFGLSISEHDVQLQATIRAAVETAYRIGLKDGLVRVGELDECND